MRKLYIALDLINTSVTLVILILGFVYFINYLKDKSTTYKAAYEDLYLCEVTATPNTTPTPKFRDCITIIKDGVTTTECTFLDYGKKVTWGKDTNFVCKQ
jgi:hypothetical protein